MEKDLVNLHHSLRSSVDIEESAESSGTEGSSNPFAVSKHWCSWKSMNGTFLVLPSAERSSNFVLLCEVSCSRLFLYDEHTLYSFARRSSFVSCSFYCFHPLFHLRQSLKGCSINYSLGDDEFTSLFIKLMAFNLNSSAFHLSIDH